MFFLDVKLGLLMLVISWFVFLLGIEGNAILDIFIPNQRIEIILTEDEKIGIYPRIYEEHKKSNNIQKARNIKINIYL